MNLHSCQDDLVNDGGGAAQEAEFFAEQEQREKHEEMVASSNKKVYVTRTRKHLPCLVFNCGRSCCFDEYTFKCGVKPCMVDFTNSIKPLTVRAGA